MKNDDRHILAREQRIGAIVLFIIVLAVWLTVAILHTPAEEGKMPNKPTNKPYRTWEQRKDSMRQADSARYAQWAAEREQRYDSFRTADKERRQQWALERQQRFDSMRIADSLWRDSVGIKYVKHIKKDTILDLNRCDTAELQLIRGIGRFTAQQIVRYREQLGGFYSPEQLTDEALETLHLDTLLSHFTASEADVITIPVNTCGINTLQRHPYLRYNQAKAIYNLRRSRIRIASADELKQLPEMTEQEVERIAPYLSFN